MTDEPKTSEQPSGHLRWAERKEFHSSPDTNRAVTRRVLQQLWYITTHRDLGGGQLDGLHVKQKEEWRDVPFVSEP